MAAAYLFGQCSLGMPTPALVGLAGIMFTPTNTRPIYPSLQIRAFPIVPPEPHGPEFHPTDPRTPGVRFGPTFHSQITMGVE
jgi:hypothetical protein